MSRRGKNKQLPLEPLNSLIPAFKFLSLIQDAKGTDEFIHSRMMPGWAIASDGILTAATPIQDDLNAYPHTQTMLDAVDRCPGPISITQLSSTSLSVRSGEFSALIPCLKANPDWPVNPDMPCGLLSDEFTTALSIVGALTSDKATTVLQASIQVRSRTVAASNRLLILEAFHGFDMPSVLLPKQAATVLAKSEKNLHKFGYSKETITFWFTDGSWMQSRLYLDPVPELSVYLDIPSNAWPVPKGMFEAIKKLAKFSSDDTVLINNSKVSIWNDGTNSTPVADVTCEGVPENQVHWSIKDALTIAPFAQTVHFNARPNMTLFFGDKVRGAISHKT